jgi:GAF domain-containing protein
VTGSSDAKRDGDRTSLVDLVMELEQQLARTRGELASIPPPSPSKPDAAETERRRQEVEELSGKLLAKYVVGYRLATSEEFSAVMVAISEVLEGMIGLTRFELYLRAGEQDELLLCMALPDAGARVGQPPDSDGIIVAAEQGDTLLPTETETDPADPDGPSAWFPIRDSDRVTGGIAVYDMVPHKQQLESDDLELLDLICSHAAEAISAGEAYSRRKYSLESFAEVVGHQGRSTRV